MSEFNFELLVELLQQAAFLGLLTIALVEAVKRNGLPQHLWEPAGFVTGFVLAGGYWMAQYQIASYQDGFWAFLFALSVALGGPAIYDITGDLMRGGRS